MSIRDKESRSLFLLAIAAVVAAGCGGGKSGSSSATLQTSKAGEAVFTYLGQPKPQFTTSSGLVSVVGQAGATFSTIRLEPPPNLDSTYVVIDRLVGGESGIYKISYPDGLSNLLYQNSTYVSTVGTSTYGTVAFDSGAGILASIKPDGSGLTAINFSVTDVYFPRYSVDGTNRLAFYSDGGLYIGPGIGGTATLIQSNDEPQGEAWNAAGTKILYSAPVGSGANCDLFVTNAGVGTPTDVTPTALQNTGVIDNPSWAPDGVSVAAMYIPSGSSLFEIIRFNVNIPGTYTDITPSGNYEQIPNFSPDGSKLEFYRDSTNSQTAGIYVEDPLGLNPTLLLADPSNAINSAFYGGAWSPFLPNEYVVSASSSVYSTFYRQAASGFLLTENGDQFGSFIAFTANTPADASIQPPTSGNNEAPLIFSLEGDSITSVGYINSYFNSGTTVSLTSTPLVLVSIDGATGQVDTMAPAATAMANPVKNSDGTVTYSAKFKAVYNGTGKNLAPNGASQLTVSPKTGKLIGFK